MKENNTSTGSSTLSDVPTTNNNNNNNNNCSKKRTYTATGSVITPTKDDDDDKIDTDTTTSTMMFPPTTTTTMPSSQYQYQQHIIPITQLRNVNIDNGIQSSSSVSNDDDNHNERTTISIPEWVMIEINGELLKPQEQQPLPLVGSIGTSNNDDDGDRNGSIIPSYELGSIEIRNSKEATMIIGTHEIQGTIESLQQPFCVLQKHYNTTLASNDSTNNKRTITNVSQSSPSSYEITGVVTTKILFSKYPKTIIRRR